MLVNLMVHNYPSSDTSERNHVTPNRSQHFTGIRPPNEILQPPVLVYRDPGVGELVPSIFLPPHRLD